MTDIFLLQPPIPEQVRPFRKETILCPPLGLSYVASTLLSHEFDVKMMDFAIMDADICDVEAETRRQSPKIVAISTTTNTYKNALKSAKVSKEVDSDVITVLGGPHVTFTPNETLTHPEIDIVVRHEGEYTMVELCDVLLRGAGDIRRINGVSYRRNNQIVNNPPRPSIEDLDRLPFPARHLLPMSLYKIPGSLITLSLIHI